MRRFLLLALWFVAGALLVLVPASPAGAHASVTSPNDLPVNTQQTIVMSVPHELEDTIYNTKVEIAVPTGWQVQGCTTKPTWTCSHAQEGGFRVITWVKSGAPSEDEIFRFTVRTPSTTGSYPFPTIQTYSNGFEAAWIGGPGTDEPAPVLRTVPNTGGPTTTRPTTPPPTHGQPGPSPTNPNNPGPNNPSPGPGDPPGPAPTAPGATTSTTEPGDASTTTDTTEPSDSSTTTDTTDRDDDDRSDDEDGGDPDTTAGDDEGGSEEAAVPGDDDGDGGAGGLVAVLIVLLLAAGAGAGLYLYRRAQAGGGAEPPSPASAA
jgi:uncharacterized protein YcnI